MKNIVTILLLSTFLFSCSNQDKEKVTVKTYSDKKSVVEVATPLCLARHDISEFEYKNHVYIYTEVHGGICVTHAGHCACNK